MAKDVQDVCSQIEMKLPQIIEINCSKTCSGTAAIHRFMSKVKVAIIFMLMHFNGTLVDS